MSLKIKLLSPRMNLRPMDSHFKRVLSPPLSLIVIAGLTPNEHTVWIEDENIERVHLDDAPDLVGMSVNVDTSERAFKLAASYLKRGIPVVFGGIHASTNPQKMLDHCSCVVVGEAENVWSGLLHDLQHGQLKQIYKSEEAADLSKSPIPNWDLVQQKKYLYHNILTVSRGCPFKCDFCYNSSSYITNPFRNRPIANVLDEIAGLNTRQVMFIDDNFIGNIGWTETFVEAIKPYGLTWHAAVSANIVHYPALITKFAEAGCRSLFIGFESIVGESIQSVGKKQNQVKNYELLISLLHSNGIMVNASLVFGFDHDTPDVFKRSMSWLVKNKIETMTAHILTPYPGTVLYRKLESEGRIIDHNPLSYNTANVVFQPSKMSVEQLQKGYLWMYKEFYSFKNIYKRTPVNKTLRTPYFLFNFGYRKFGRLTSLVGRLGIMDKIGKLARKISYGIE